MTTTNDQTTTADIATSDKWQCRNKLLAPWFIRFAESLEKHPVYGLFIKKRTKALNNGKTAVDSNAAISAIHSGVHLKLARRCNAKIPYPPGQFINSCNEEVDAEDATLCGTSVL